MSIVGVRTELEITCDAEETRSDISTDLIFIEQPTVGAPVESHTSVADFSKYTGKALNSIGNKSAVRMHKAALKNNTSGYIEPPPAVPIFSGPIPDLPLVINVLMTPVDYSTYFTNATSYAITQVPVGLAFDTVTGILSGTPTVVSGTSPIITASNANGDTPSNAFSISVA